MINETLKKDIEEQVLTFDATKEQVIKIGNHEVEYKFMNGSLHFESFLADENFNNSKKLTCTFHIEPSIKNSLSVKSSKDLQLEVRYNSSPNTLAESVEYARMVAESHLINMLFPEQLLREREDYVKEIIYKYLQ